MSYSQDYYRRNKERMIKNAKRWNSQHRTKDYNHSYYMKRREKILGKPESEIGKARTYEEKIEYLKQFLDEGWDKLD